MVRCCRQHSWWCEFYVAVDLIIEERRRWFDQPLWHSRWSSKQPKTKKQWMLIRRTFPCSLTATNWKRRYDCLETSWVTATANKAELHRCLSSIHKWRLFSKKLKASLNYHVSPSQLHHRREHCLLFAAWRVGYAQLWPKKDWRTAHKHVHGDVWDGLGVGSLMEEPHQHHQPREKGHMWS